MISIVIPLYNKEKQIVNTLKSVFNQNFQDFEIIIVDDGSSDNSVNLVKEFDDKRITIISQVNQGVSAARNTGIKQAKRDYIAFLDADDEWETDYLQEQVDLINNYPECSVFACAYELKNYKGELEQIVLNKMPFSSQTGVMTNYFEVASCSHPPLWTSAVVVKKDAILSVDGFPVGVKSGEDLLTWARLAVKYKIAYSRKAYAIFVLDVSHNVDKKPVRLHDEKDIVGNGLKSLYLNNHTKIRSSLRKYLSLWYKMRASVFLRSSDKSNTIKYSLKSAYYNLTNWKVYAFIIIVLLPEKLQLKIKKYYVRE
jgi:glycosyltransferase involved in cell wall biosynthesis